MNITLTQLCREGRLKHAMHILLTTNTDTHYSLLSSTCFQVLQTCIANKALPEGKLLHSFINRIRLKFNRSTNIFLQNRLIHMYLNCGSLEDAREIFDCMIERDIFSWNMLISGYQRHGFHRQALTVFHQMQQTSAVVQPDQFTFPSVLKSCTKLGDLQQALCIHQRVFKSGFLSHVVVVNALLDMYAKCGSVEKARELFDKMHDADIVLWTAMIAGYAQKGYVERARELFDKMSHRNAVSWTAMIAGYTQNGFYEKALETYKQMQLSDVKPNSATFASILPACATVGALEEGMDIHQRIVENGFSPNIVVVSALIDMYAKCGRIHKARELFDKMHYANTVSWTTMIGGYAVQGYSNDALQLFDLMKHLGTNPDSITFLCVLLACSHAGLVDEGCTHFNSMSDSYPIIPGMNHYTCIVDLLGRAGYLEEVFNFIVKMPIKPELDVWMCLLGACRSHKNVGTGEFVATILFFLEPKYAPSYVLLSNMYAEVGSWDDVQRVRTLMKDRGIKKSPGCSWIEVDKRVHAFLVGDKSHPQIEEIYGKLEKLSSEMKAVGYIPSTIPGLRDVEADDKQLLLCQHSEKLAIAFGLLKTPPGSVIRVVKNLRVCDDCHTATKFISKIVARDIVVRDANRFHHFKDGECSCGDYW